jgi:hypothetical protein
VEYHLIPIHRIVPLRLSALVILYIHSLKGIFQSSSRFSSLYCFLSHSFIYHTLCTVGSIHRIFSLFFLPPSTLALSPHSREQTCARTSVGPGCFSSLPPHLLSLPVRARRQAQGRAWAQAAFYRTHASTPHLAFETPSAILA